MHDTFVGLGILSDSFSSQHLVCAEEVDSRNNFKDIVLEFATQTKESVLVEFCQTFINSLESKMEQLNKIRDAMEERRKHKNEYDYYYEKVRRLRGRDSEKAQEKAQSNEKKLSDAKAVLQQSSAPLLAVFLEYESSKGQLIKQVCESIYQE